MTTGPTARTGDSPTEQIAALRATITAQVQAGNLDTTSAEELTDKLDDIDHELADNKPDRAAEKVTDLRKKLNDLRKNDKISRDGYTDVQAGLDQLTATLPAAGNQNSGGGRDDD